MLRSTRKIRFQTFHVFHLLDRLEHIKNIHIRMFYRYFIRHLVLMHRNLLWVRSVTATSMQDYSIHEKRNQKNVKWGKKHIKYESSRTFLIKRIFLFNWSQMAFTEWRLRSYEIKRTLQLELGSSTFRFYFLFHISRRNWCRTVFSQKCIQGWLFNANNEIQFNEIIKKKKSSIPAQYISCKLSRWLEVFILSILFVVFNFR